MNLAFKYPIIFWNCACLITDSGGTENKTEDDSGIYFEEETTEEVVDIYEPEDFDEYEYEDAPDRKTKVKKKRTKTTDYNKLATAIGKMSQSGINIVPPDINNSNYTFTPDVANNRILYGLSGMTGVGEEIIQETIKNRPYASIKDYYNRVKPKKPAMITLIKGGAFDSLMDRKEAMVWYIWETCDKKSRITLQNMGGLIKHGLLPEKTEEQSMARRVYEFNRYLKAITKADKCAYEGMYSLDERAIAFLYEIDCEELTVTDNISHYLKIKEWDNVYQRYMDIFRKWIASDKEEILNSLNNEIFIEDWNKYAKGNYSSWEMNALCFYYHEHELANVNRERYGLSNFYNLPEDPEVERTFRKAGKTINMFKLTTICGTCIAKNKAKATVTLLTNDGVVTVKFRKEYFSIFDKQISEKNADGTKTVKEKSWFNKGSMILVQGIRSGDQFVAKKYSSSGNPHQLYKIDAILPNGELILRNERYQGNSEEE